MTTDRRKIFEYLKVWATMAPKHIRTYLEAAIAQSYGYYAFTLDHAEGAGNGNAGMTIFDWVEDPRFDPSLWCHYIPGMENLRQILNIWAKIWHKIPVLNFTDIKALYTWGIVLIGYHILRRRKDYVLLLPLAAEIIMILTCIDAPINDCFRYFSPVAASFPVLLLLLSAIHEVNKTGYTPQVETN